MCVVGALWPLITGISKYSSYKSDSSLCMYLCIVLDPSRMTQSSADEPRKLLGR